MSHLTSCCGSVVLCCFFHFASFSLYVLGTWFPDISSALNWKDSTEMVVIENEIQPEDSGLKVYFIIFWVRYFEGKRIDREKN